MMYNVKNLGKKLAQRLVVWKSAESGGQLQMQGGLALIECKKLQNKISLEKVTFEKSTHLFQKLFLVKIFIVFRISKNVWKLQKRKNKNKIKKKGIEVLFL